MVDRKSLEIHYALHMRSSQSKIKSAHKFDVAQREIRQLGECWTTHCVYIYTYIYMLYNYKLLLLL